MQHIGGDAAAAALALDAARFAKADRADYQRRRALGPSPVHQLLRDLPEARRLVLAGIVAEDSDLRISELVEVLLTAGRGERVIPALARLIAGRENGEQVFVLLQRGAMGNPC